jgi:hypothetical protein
LSESGARTSKIASEAIAAVLELHDKTAKNEEFLVNQQVSLMAALAPPTPAGRESWSSSGKLKRFIGMPIVAGGRLESIPTNLFNFLYYIGDQTQAVE